MRFLFIRYCIVPPSHSLAPTLISIVRIEGGLGQAEWRTSTRRYAAKNNNPTRWRDEECLQKWGTAGWFKKKNKAEHIETFTRNTLPLFFLKSHSRTNNARDQNRKILYISIIHNHTKEGKKIVSGKWCPISSIALRSVLYTRLNWIMQYVAHVAVSSALTESFSFFLPFSFFLLFYFFPTRTSFFSLWVSKWIQHSVSDL